MVGGLTCSGASVWRAVVRLLMCCGGVTRSSRWVRAVGAAKRVQRVREHVWIAIALLYALGRHRSQRWWHCTAKNLLNTKFQMKKSTLPVILSHRGYRLGDRRVHGVEAWIQRYPWRSWHWRADWVCVAYVSTAVAAGVSVSGIVVVRAPISATHVIHRASLRAKLFFAPPLSPSIAEPHLFFV